MSTDAQNRESARMLREQQQANARTHRCIELEQQKLQRELIQRQNVRSAKRTSSEQQSASSSKSGVGGIFVALLFVGGLITFFGEPSKERAPSKGSVNREPKSDTVAPQTLQTSVAETLPAPADRRSIRRQAADDAIIKAAKTLSAITTLPQSRVSVRAYGGVVLITGEVASVDQKMNVEEAVNVFSDVNHVANFLAVTDPATADEKAFDVPITKTLRKAFDQDGRLNSKSLQIVTSRGVVYLLGRVTRSEADIAERIARQISGVKDVFSAFEVGSVNELAQVSLN